jgi:hypothetical protein
MLQPWFVEIISFISDVIVGLSALIVSIAAVLGLFQWRAELKGKARLDMARRLTLLAYQFRDQYISSRSIITFIQESADREELPSETKSETHYRDEHYARMNRVRLIQGTMRELYQAAWEAEIIFDKNVEALIRPLANSFNELWGAIDTYFSRYIERASKDATVDASDLSWLEKYQKIIYGHADDDHAQIVSESVMHLVQEIKAIV